MPDLDIDLPPIYPTITNGEVKVNGVLVNGVSAMNVDLLANEGSGTFSLTTSNISGLNADTFHINDDVEIYFPDSNGVSHLVLKGFVDNVNNSQFGTVIAKGQDYTGKLLNVFVNEVYSNREVSNIISNATDGVFSYLDDFGITANNVQITTTTLDVFKVSQKSAWQTLKELADRVNYAFYVDTDKDLHFEPKSDVSSGVTLTSQTGRNVVAYSFENDYKKQANSVTVFGAPQYFKAQTSGANYPTQALDGDDVTKTFPLSFTPEKPLVEVKVGGVAKTEGVDFSVDYELSTISFVTAPAAGTGNVYVTYDYNKSVFATWSDASNEALYGPKEMVVYDQDITSTEAARTLAQANVNAYSDPKTILKIKTSGKVASPVKPAQSVIVTIPAAELNGAAYNVVELAYSWSKSGFMCDWTLATIDASLSDVLKTLKQDLIELKRRGLTKTVASETLIAVTVQLGSISLVPLTRDINTSFIAGVSLAGQHGAVAGDKRTYTFA